MDYEDGSTVTIPGNGVLNVLGRLHFPSSASVVLRTKAVFVQGIWSMMIPDENKLVRVTLYGHEEHTIYPHDLCCNTSSKNIFSRHASLCNPECEDRKSIGMKPFAVVGGERV